MVLVDGVVGCDSVHELADPRRQCDEDAVSDGARRSASARSGRLPSEGGGRYRRTGLTVPQTDTRSCNPVVAGFLSMVVPGAGQMYAGALRAGAILVVATLLTLIALLAALRRLDLVSIAAAAVREEVLLGLLAVNGALLVARALIVADAWRRGRPSSGKGRYLQASALVLLLVLTAAPHAVAGYVLLTTRDVVQTVFADEEPGDMLPTRGPNRVFLALPTSAPVSERKHVRAARPSVREGRVLFPASRGAAAAPWTTILLLGGDAGAYRTGLRTDTMIVVALQEGTGKAVALGIPRNLEDVPLRGRAAEALGYYPDLLNALYQYGNEHPELFPGGRDPGVTALKQTISNLIGIRIQYSALVDLRAFAELVDAIGGVTVRVHERILDELSPPNPGEPWIDLDLYPGQRVRFDGRQALAYARARSQSSDYRRMARQRCLLSALAEQLHVGKLFRGFPRIAKAIRANVRTDIPLRRAPELIRSIAAIDPGRTVTITLGPPGYGLGHSYSSTVPDIAAIRAIVRKAVLLAPRNVRRDDGVLTMRLGC